MQSNKHESLATETATVEPIINQNASTKLNMKLQGMLESAANSAGQKEHTERPNQKEHTERPNQ